MAAPSRADGTSPNTPPSSVIAPSAPVLQALAFATPHAFHRRLPDCLARVRSARCCSESGPGAGAGVGDGGGGGTVTVVFKRYIGRRAAVPSRLGAGGAAGA